MDGAKRDKAMRNMINGLYEYGYIDEKYKRTLEYRLDTGDTKVFKEIQNYLIQIAGEITL